MNVFRLILNFFLDILCFSYKPPMLMVETGSIYQLAAETWAKQTLTSSKDTGTFMAADYHWNKQYLYYTKMDGKLYRKSFSDFGTSRPDLVLFEKDMVLFSQFAVDWVDDKIFWLDYNLNYTLFVSDLSGQMTKALAVLNLERTILRLTIDPYNKYLYFASGNGIERIGLDGSNRELVYTTPMMKTVFNKIEITVDYDNDRVYFYGSMTSNIQSVKTDGTDLRTELARVYDCKFMTYYQNNLYFLGKKHDLDTLVRYSPTDRTRNEEPLETLLGDYRIFHPFAQNPGENPCSDNNGGCSHLCLPRPSGGFTCQCPDGSRPSGGFTCQCPDGSRPSGGFICQCPDGSRPSGGFTCQCPDGYTKSSNNCIKV